MTIFTDQDHAMASALHKVMPNVHHGLCTWHIMQNAIKNVVNIVRDDCSLLKDFKRCMYVYGDEEKFEEAWETIIDYYNVKENHWLKAMYEKKEKWAKCYMKSVYTLGMRSTQLSESLNGCLKDYLKSDLCILQFFKNFERVIEDKRYNELKAEFDSRKKLPRVRMHKSPLLQQVAQIYTPSIFDLFQEEFDWSLSATIKERKENHPLYTYVVTMFNQGGEYTITSNHLENSVFCSCKKFERYGFLCCHALKVLDVMDVKLLPQQYIIKRWTREAKKGSVQDYHGRDVHLYANVSATQRYRSLCPKLVKLASRASESQEACELVERLIGELTTQIESICFTEVKGDGDDCKVNESLSKDKDSKNSDVLPVGVKGLKKKAGKKGRPRMKSWVETQPKKKKIQAKDKVMASKHLSIVNVFRTEYKFLPVRRMDIDYAESRNN
ncbi:FAR1-related sequence 5-like protein [Tanacetum coccineum]